MAIYGGGRKPWAYIGRCGEGETLLSLKKQRKEILDDMARFAADAQRRQLPDEQRAEFRALAARCLTVDLPTINSQIKAQEGICAGIGAQEFSQEAFA